MSGHHLSQSLDQQGKDANPARGQLNRDKFFSLSPFGPEKFDLARPGSSIPSRVSPAHSPTQAESSSDFNVLTCT